MSTGEGQKYHWFPPSPNFFLRFLRILRFFRFKLLWVLSCGLGFWGFFFGFVFGLVFFIKPFQKGVKL